jgi:phosphotransferase system HPr-like phosphotransfer protein
MKSVKISLQMASQVKAFVSIVQKYSYDIDLRSDRYVVDAKSILGIFSLDLSDPINV